MTRGERLWRVVDVACFVLALALLVALIFAPRLWAHFVTGV